MILYLLTPKGRHAIGDCFKNMVNSLPEKDKVFLVHGQCYDSKEFVSGFSGVVAENFFQAGRIGSKIKAIGFALKLRMIMKKRNIKQVFIFDECEWFNIFFYYATLGMGLDWNIYIHDPLSHSGERNKIMFVRDFVYKNIVRKSSKIFVSYSRAVGELVKDKEWFSNKDISVRYLPRMKELEFPDIRKKITDKTIDMEYDVAFFGRLEEYKGIDMLLKALSILKDEYKTVCRTIVVGSRGNKKDIVIEYAARNDNVTFIGEYIESRELAEYIAKSRVIVLAYKDATGTQTVQSANYYHKPVIANDVGCFNEYVENGINGFIIKDIDEHSLAEAIYKLSTDNEFYTASTRGIDNKMLKDFDLDEFSSSIFYKITGGKEIK